MHDFHLGTVKSSQIMSIFEKISGYGKNWGSGRSFEPGKNPFPGRQLARFAVVECNTHEIGHRGFEPPAFLPMFAHKAVDGDNRA